MIQPVQDNFGTHFSVPIENCKRQQNEVYSDSIQYGKREPFSWIEKCKQLLEIVWSWIQTYLLCFFIEENAQSLGNKLEKFIDEYYSKDGDRKSEKIISRKYKKMETGIQKLIDNEIFIILKEVYPEASRKLHEQYYQKVVKSPFLELKAENGSRFFPFGEALIRAKEKLVN